MTTTRNEVGRWPKKSETTQWVLLLREAAWMSLDDMLSIHAALHKAFGAEPSDAVLEGEQQLSHALRAQGIEHRYKDALSDAAGTTIEQPVEPTLEEVNWYLKSMTLHSSAISILQGVENGNQVYVDINVGGNVLTDGMQKTLMKTINKMMPPGVTLKPRPKKPQEDFIREMGAYDLVLQPAYAPVQVKPWKQLVSTAPASVFKEDRLEITVKQIVKAEEVVLKEGEPAEKFMLGPVLIPEEEDAQGEIYSKVEVRKACHWWAENSGSFSQRHVLQGGTPLDGGEIVMLENYVMPVTCEINGVTIKEGTWMLGAGARDDAIWAKAVSGQLRSWSIGAEALSWMETVND